MTISQGDIYWVATNSAYMHPHVVIQVDASTQTITLCAVTTNAKQATLPGNILLETGEANLSKPSIVVVSQVFTVEQAKLGAYIGTLSAQRVAQIQAGMRFIQRLTEYRM